MGGKGEGVERERRERGEERGEKREERGRGERGEEKNNTETINDGVSEMWGSID